MAEIRKEIDPERFLSATAREFNVVPGEHAISKAKMVLHVLQLATEILMRLIF